MLTTLLAAALLTPAAPVPRDAAPTGPAPYILNLKAGPDGEVKVFVARVEKAKVTVMRAVGGPNGAQAVQPVEQEYSYTKMVALPLADLKELKVYTADGKDVAVKDAVKKVNDGGLFVASANGKKVDASYLKLFKDDVMVFVSPDLIPQGGNSGYGGGFTQPGFGGGPAVMPAFPVAPPLPAIAPPPAPGGVQVQIVPAVEQPVLLPPVKKEER